MGRLTSFWVFAFALTIWSPSASARRVTAEDAGFQTETTDEIILAKADGTWVSERTTVFRLLHESAAEKIGLARVSFNSAQESIEILEATTELSQKKYPVPETLIETRPAVASAPGFDDIKEVFIPFQRVEVGARLTLKVRRHLHTPSRPGLLELRIPILNSLPVNRYKLTLSVPEQTQVIAHDPLKKLSTKKSKTTWVFQTKNLVGRSVTAEASSAPNPNEFLFVDVSRVPSWEALGATFLDDWEKILNGPLPDSWVQEFKKIPQGNQRQAALEVWKKVVRSIRYFGDWRTVEGGYVPRKISTIVESGYGDCKDFAALLTKSFRSVGLQAYPAFIERGNYSSPLTSAPVTAAFNHAIAIVEVDGARWLVDGTNSVPHPAIIPPDLEDRPFLMLRPSPRFEIPKPVLDHRSIGEANVTFDLTEMPEVTTEAHLIYRDSFSWLVRNGFFGRSPSQIREFLLQQLDISPEDASDFQLLKSNWDDPSQIETTEFHFKVKQPFGIRRSGDHLISKSLEADLSLRVSPLNRISAVNLRPQGQRTSRTTFKWNPQSYSLLGKPLECRTENKTLKFKRSLSTTPESLTVEDHLETFEDRISPEELNPSTSFGKSFETLRNCLLDMDVTFQEVSPL